MNGRILFAIPSTPLVRVRVVRDGVNYDHIISNPRTNERLQQVLLGRQVGMSTVSYVAAMPERRSYA